MLRGGGVCHDTPGSQCFFVDGKLVANPYKKWSEVNSKLPAVDIAAYIPGEKHGTREVFVLETTSGSPSMTLRPSAPMTGEVVDPSTGTVLTSLQYDAGTEEAWHVALPGGHAVLLVRLDRMTKGQGS